MRHKRRPTPSIVNSIRWKTPAVWCAVDGKDLYIEKKNAKRAVRTTSEPGLAVYRCEVLDGWHIGHLPVQVRLGRVTRSEYYNKKEE